MNARPCFSWARAATLIVGAASLALGCKRLPETIPYEARIANKDDGRGVFRVGELNGADLTLDGRKVARLDARGSEAIVVGHWSGPKSELRSVMTGKYAVSIDGPCGPFSLSAGSPPASWASMSDREVAKIVAKEPMPLFLEVELPKAHRLFVDRGSSTGTLRVGSLVIDPGKQMITVGLPGCAAAPTVTLDGAALGTLDLGAKANLITLEPGVCHVLQEVVYGDQPPTQPPLTLPANAVVALSDEPLHFLTPAPDSLRIANRTGTSSSELLRTSCPGTKNGVVDKAQGAPTEAGGKAAATKKGIPESVVQRVVQRNSARFRLCYENGLRRNPGLKGRVTVQFVVDPSGAVSSAADHGSDLADSDVVACVVRSFKALSFPQPEGGKDATVVYPMTFSP